jgi:hypothetical protein
MFRGLILVGEGAGDEFWDSILVVGVFLLEGIRAVGEVMVASRERGTIDAIF